MKRDEKDSQQNANKSELDVVDHFCNFSTWEADAGGL
jgi:hypothetical protein